MEEKKIEVVKGCPPAVLLPALEYKFKVIYENIAIQVRRKGVYNEIAPEIFDPSAGAFDLLVDTKAGTVLYTPAITMVLFAEHKYPPLGKNQAFALTALVFNTTTVDVVGSVIEFLED